MAPTADEGGAQERIRIVGIEDRIEADSSIPGGFAIYLELSRLPGQRWREAFLQEMAAKAATRRRDPLFVPERHVRIVIGGREHVETVCRQVAQVVASINDRLGLA